MRVDGASSMDARGGGVAGLLAELALTLAPAAPALAAGKQPIDWLLEETVSGASSLGGIVKESLAESGIATKEAPAPSADEDAGASGGGIDVGSTAVKFGKLGVILVFADVVTFAVMGRSVLGIMDDGGEEGGRPRWRTRSWSASRRRRRRRRRRAATKTATASGERVVSSYPINLDESPRRHSLNVTPLWPSSAPGGLYPFIPNPSTPLARSSRRRLGCSPSPPPALPL